MGSLGFGELLFIGVVVLIVFGPKRLPEIARRAGELMAKARAATKELTDSLDAEFEGTTAPLKDLQTEYRATRDQLSDSASKITDLTAVEFDGEPTPAAQDTAAEDTRDGDGARSAATDDEGAVAEDADGELEDGGAG